MQEKKKEILAVIPARGGSKGIKGKNIRRFDGKPLIVHTIEAAQNAPSVSRIIVSTQDEEIARVSREAGAGVPFLRPVELAQDTSAVVDAIVHLLNKLKTDEGYEPTHILLLQPTNPMRTAEDIETAVRMYDERGADSLASVCSTEQLLLTKDAGDVLTITNPEYLVSENRQELPKTYRLDGCIIYLIDAKLFLKEKSFFAGKLVGYEIEPWRAVDLDDPADFVVGEIIHAHRDEIEIKIRNFDN